MSGVGVPCSGISSVRRFRVQGCEFAVDMGSGACLPAAEAGESGGAEAGGRPSETTRLERQTLLNGGAFWGEISALRANRHMSVLDVGCGTGGLTNALAAYARNVVGLDITQSNLDLAIRKAADARVTNVTHVLGDYRNEPSLERQFDLAVARLVFEHSHDPVSDACAMSRFLRPGGRLAAIDIDDGLSIDYPERPPALERLWRAHIEYQRSVGGDRFVGRKLFRYFASAGLTGISIQILQGCHVTPAAPDAVAPGVAQFILHFTSIRDYLVESGVITREELEDAIEAGIEHYGAAGVAHYSQMLVVTGRATERMETR